jgi:hypothetical protein
MWKDEIKKQLNQEQASSLIQKTVEGLIALLNTVSTKQANLDLNQDGQVTNLELQDVMKALEGMKQVKEFLEKIYR